jgi:hypothetical protein
MWPHNGFSSVWVAGGIEKFAWPPDFCGVVQGEYDCWTNMASVGHTLSLAHLNRAREISILPPVPSYFIFRDKFGARNPNIIIMYSHSQLCLVGGCWRFFFFFFFVVFFFSSCFFFSVVA